jgi:Ca-activated chloride channel homolog
MTFAQPIWLLLLLLLLPALRFFQKKKQHTTPLTLPEVAALRNAGGWRSKIKQWLPLLQWVSIGLLSVAMARPQLRWREEKVTADALDIVLCMDISLSMLSRDFEPDRLAVAKRVAVDFVEKRPHDRLGLVAFSAEAFTQCPLTTDRSVVQSFIRRLEIGRLEHGTAIGMGLATAVNRLKDSPSKSKIVILLTDGENNAGYIAPDKAAEIAQTLGIRVYTVGIGTDGVVMSPEGQNPDGSFFFAPRMMHFDTELLEAIAANTGGLFYRAQSEQDLEGIYDEIDRLEKTKIEINTLQHTKDLFPRLVGAAVILLLLDFFIRRVWLKSITH